MGQDKRNKRFDGTCETQKENECGWKGKACSDCQGSLEKGQGSWQGDALRGTFRESGKKSAKRSDYWLHALVSTWTCSDVRTQRPINA